MSLLSNRGSLEKVKRQSVAQPAVADGQLRSAEAFKDHFQDARAGEDDVGALGLQARDGAALFHRALGVSGNDDRELFEGLIAMIAKLKEDLALVFDLLIYACELKPGIEMPYLQRSKITKWSDDFVLDNGRVISGTVAQITYTEIDLELFINTYDFKMIAVKNCYMSAKAYLPEWLRNYIYELFFYSNQQISYLQIYPVLN